MAENLERFDEHVKQYRAEEEPKLLEEFRAEIMGLKAAEAETALKAAETGGELPTSHFGPQGKRFDPKYLGVKEMNMWRQVHEGRLPEGELDVYHTELFLEDGEYAETEEQKISVETRRTFLGLVANAAMGLSYKKDKA